MSGSAWVCAGVHGYALVCSSVRRCEGVCMGVCGCTRVCANIHRCVQKYVGICGCLWNVFVDRIPTGTRVLTSADFNMYLIRIFMYTNTQGHRNSIISGVAAKKLLGFLHFLII